MLNTFLPDSDLVYVRADGRKLDDDLVEIAFEDMEPLEAVDLIGVEPHTAVAILPYLDFECVGVHPYGAVTMTPAPAYPRADEADLIEDAIPTEEFSQWERDGAEAWA
ncbi:MAG: hypothetical protein H6737_28390 [Alphaproteobacteria bacterium]|nr:hypothetical protein [Alphaproteobacteria bacterium]